MSCIGYQEPQKLGHEEAGPSRTAGGTAPSRPHRQQDLRQALPSPGLRLCAAEAGLLQGIQENNSRVEEAPVSPAGDPGGAKPSLRPSR